MTLEPLIEPGKGAGLIDVVRRRWLLSLLVNKEMRVRYRGSVLGLLWSYVKPATQFVVFYFAMGVFLGLNKGIDNFSVYLFSGIVLINFFGEAFGNATRSVVWNAPLVKKIYLPRELFPVASVIVAVLHFIPQLVVLLIGALITGWTPDLVGMVAAVVGFVIMVAFSTGLGLLFGSINVLFRDAENFVDLLLLVAQWSAPVLYPWTSVQNALAGTFWLQIYLANPLAVAVSMFHRAFWYDGRGTQAGELLPDLWARGAITLAICGVILALGQYTFRRLEGRFAAEL